MLFLDIETRSECNISDRRKDLPTVSTDVYCSHPSTEALCLAWAVDDAPVSGFVFRYENDHDDRLFGVTKAKGDPLYKLDPLKKAAVENGPLVAHNSGFEQDFWEKKLVPLFDFPEIDPENWRCSMAAAGHFGAPLGLGAAAEFLGLDGKSDDSVMRRLCLPVPGWFRDPSVRKWAGTKQDFKDLLTYCKQDVEACRAVYLRCPKMESNGELQVWQVDQKINRRGIYVDPELVRECTLKAAELRERSGRELVELTGGKVETPKQGERITKWLASRGYHLPNAQQKTFEDFVAQSKDLPEDVRQIVELRLGGAGAAETKFPAIASRTSSDGRVRGCFVYYGGRTGRWSARGVQPQNLKKPPKAFDIDLIETLIPDIQAGNWDAAEMFGTTRDVLTAMLRPTFRAPPGKTLVCLDYSAIEARLTGWHAGEENLLREFRDYDAGEGPEPYVVMANKINRRRPVRALGKAAILGLGFGMGAPKFLATCQAWGIPADPDEITRAVDVFRQSYPRIPEFWRSMTNAFRRAVSRPGEEVRVNRLVWLYIKERDVLLLRLPSGRSLFYHRPRLGTEGNCKYWGRLGADEKGGIGEVRGWGGKWTENAVQATAADVQRHAIVSLDKYLPEAPVVLHAHDEIVTEVDPEEANRIYDCQRSIMLSIPRWGDDIPLDAKGWIGKRYRKD